MEHSLRMRSVMSQSVAGGLLQIITDIYWNGALTYFYLRNLGLSASYEAAVWVIFSVWNTVDNLITGSIEDRSDNRTGRRIPYLRTFAPAAGLVFCLSFFKLPFANTQMGLAMSFLLALCVLDFMIAFLQTALFSIPYEETLVRTERGKVLIWQAIFMSMSIVVTVVIIPEIQPDPGDDLFLFRAVMCSIGIAAGLGIFIATFFIDSTYRIDRNRVLNTSRIKYIFACLKNRAFLSAEIFGTASVMAYSIFIFGLYYYFDEVCTDQLPCYICAFGGIIVGMILYFLLIHRVEIKTLAVASTIFSGGMMLAGYFTGGTVVGGAVACFGCGIQYVAEMLYFWLMFGDAVDADEVRSGIRREGTYNGFDCVFSSISNATQPLFLAIIMAYGYIEHQPPGTQSLHAQHGIMAAWLLPTSLVLITAGILTWILYPLSNRDVEANKRILEERRGPAGEKNEAEQGREQ